MSSSGSDNEEMQPLEQDVDDNERTVIRSELSSLSFEELQKLKERIGAKVYKEALFGNETTNDTKPKVFRRENKNRPREMSSKKPVPMASSNIIPTKKKDIRDPRFDPLCGEFDKQQFNSDYNFLSNIRGNDIKAIKSELKQTADPERQTKLRRLLQRLTEQHRTSKKKKMEAEKMQKQQQQGEHQNMKEGRLPHFKNKSELRVEALVKQYEELKSAGSSRVQRHLKRRQQKVKKRSHRAPTGAS